MPPLKGLYFTSVNKDELRNKRIIDKCLGQIACFEEKGWRTDFITQSDKGLVYNDQQIGSKSTSPKIKWVQEKIYTLVGNYREVSEICQEQKYDYIFFRHSFFNPAALRLFKRIKKINPRTLIIVEISTFPYKQEYKGLLKKPLSWVDTMSAKYIKKNVDYIASCSPDTSILGIPVLHFSNGVLQENREIALVNNTHEGIRMVAIASNISYWHGFDRIIYGLKTFANRHSDKIYFDIIGKGSAKKELEQLVNTLGIAHIVNFIDEIPNNEVLETLSKYDFGFSTLGMHRKGVAYDSSMKSRDYAYAGLPFVLAAPDANFKEDYPYSMYVPPNDTELDIEKCLAFFKNIKSNSDNYRQEIVAFASNNLTWSVTFKNIVNCINQFALLPYKQKQLNAFCYYFPPIKAIGSIRTFSFVQQMLHNGFETNVYSTSNANLCFTNEDLFEERIETKKIRTFDFRTLFDRPHKKGAGNASIKASASKAAILKLLNSFPFNIIIGEGGLIYIIRGYQMAKKEISTSAIIFSSFRPYSDHIIAYLLKRKFKNLYWIADFRDLHYDKHINDFYIGWLQNWFNKQVLKKASLVTTISIGLQEKLLHYHNDVYVLRNGIIEQENKEEIECYDKFTINYTGSLYEGKRDSKLLFKAVAQLIKDNKIGVNQIQLQYAGQHGQLWDNWIAKYGLEDMNLSLGMVSTKDAMLMQKRSHVNLLLSWSSAEVSGILTGKFYEYLKTKNPIVLIINGTQDKEFEAVFEETNCGKVFYSTTAQSQISDYVLQLYNQWQADKNLTSFRTSVQNEQYKWPELMGTFISEKL